LKNVTNWDSPIETVKPWVLKPPSANEEVYYALKEDEIDPSEQEHVIEMNKKESSQVLE